MSTEVFPTFLKLSHRRVLVVGGGPVAASKLAALTAAGADITVVAPQVVADIRATSATIHEREFVEADLEGAWFVVAAAPPDVNRRVSAAAELRHLFVNAVDDPAHASAYLGGVVRKQGVTLAISTGGRAPALAGLLREGLEAALPDDLSEWFDVADRARKEWKAREIPMHKRRPSLAAMSRRSSAASNGMRAPSSRPFSAPTSVT